MKNIKIDLQNINKVDQGFWTLGVLFESTDFEYIKDKVINAAESDFSPGPPTHPDVRRELTWTRDGVLDELWEGLNELSGYMSELTELNLKFGQVRVWKDLPGFMIPFHEDDKSSAAHIQIYIHGPSNSIGTTWYTTHGRTTLPFIENSGYITVCKERYPHGMLEPVSGGNRYSLYITFKEEI